MTVGKHSPARLSTYVNVHNNVMDGFKRSGFVGIDLLAIRDLRGAGFFTIEGELGCLGNIVITVQKILDIVDNCEEPIVQTSRYAYNVRVYGQHNVFRYDNLHAHAGHADAHHKDLFEFTSGNRLAPEWIGEAGWPTLGEVIAEAEQWYYANRHCLSQPDDYPPRDALAAVPRSRGDDPSAATV